MNDADRDLLAAIEARADEWDSPVRITLPVHQQRARAAAADRRDLLRMLRALEADIRQTAAYAQDAADDAALARWTADRIGPR